VVQGVGGSAARQGRTERYITAGIPVVFDRKHEREVEVAKLDPMLRKPKS
jgi:hypothetical protein